MIIMVKFRFEILDHKLNNDPEHIISGFTKLYILKLYLFSDRQLLADILHKYLGQVCWSKESSYTSDNGPEGGGGFNTFRFWSPKEYFEIT